MPESFFTPRPEASSNAIPAVVIHACDKRLDDMMALAARAKRRLDRADEVARQRQQEFDEQLATISDLAAFLADNSSNPVETRKKYSAVLESVLALADKSLEGDEEEL